MYMFIKRVSFWIDMSGQKVQIQFRLLPKQQFYQCFIRVRSVCYSICVFWKLCLRIQYGCLKLRAFAAKCLVKFLPIKHTL